MLILKLSDLLNECGHKWHSILLATLPLFTDAVKQGQNTNQHSSQRHKGLTDTQRSIFFEYKRSKSEAVLQCSGSVNWCLYLGLYIEKTPVHKPLHHQTLIITALNLFKHWQTDWQTWCNAGVKYASYIPVNFLFWYKWLYQEYHYSCLAFEEKYQNFQHGHESGTWMQASFSRDKKYISNDPFYLLLQPSDPGYIQLAQNSHSQCSKSHKVLENDLRKPWKIICQYNRFSLWMHTKCTPGRILIFKS